MIKIEDSNVTITMPSRYWEVLTQVAGSSSLLSRSEEFGEIWISENEDIFHEVFYALYAKFLQE